MMQPDLRLVALAHRNDAVEDRFPILVAREIVVGEQEVADTVLPVLVDGFFDIVGRAAARLAPLHVDDGAERALIRAAAPGVETRQMLHGPAQIVGRQDGNRARLDRRQIVEVVVDRLQRSVRGIAQDRVDPPLEFTGEQADADVEGGAQVGLQLGQHRETAGDVESADHDRHAGGAELARDVRARGETGSTARRPAPPCRARRCGETAPRSWRF